MCCLYVVLGCRTIRHRTVYHRTFSHPTVHHRTVYHRTVHYRTVYHLTVYHRRYDFADCHFKSSGLPQVKDCSSYTGYSRRDYGSELMSCVKMEVAVLGSQTLLNSPHRLCGRKATLNSYLPELRSCVKAEVAILGSPPRP